MSSDMRDRAPLTTTELLLHEDVPLPGSVAGRRIVRLDLAKEDLRPDGPLGELFVSLGFTKSDEAWGYDRNRAVEWFLAELRGLPYTWSQDPWRLPAETGQPPADEHEAGPRPPRLRPGRDERPRRPGTVVK